MKILAFSGKRGSGKTTAARYIQCQTAMPYAWQPSILGFFDTAKEWYRRGMGLPSDIDWSSQEFKDKKLPEGNTHRDGLILFGTTYCRSLNPDWWVNVWSSVVDELDEDLILVPDVRFPNELKAIRERSGHVIRLLRAPHPEDQNETETALDCLGPDWYFDAVIDNREMSQNQMCEAVWGLCKDREWV